MRTSLMVLASVLLIQLLATTAHGIRLDRQLDETLKSKQLELAAGDSKAGQASDTVVHSTNRRCTSDGNCSGKARKPVAPHAAAPGAAKHQIPSKRNGDDGQEAEVTMKSRAGGKEAAARTWSQRALPRQARTYPDILDIAGMDYSPAGRRPPIHN